jgi:hypothetical protein
VFGRVDGVRLWQRRRSGNSLAAGRSEATRGTASVGGWF